MKIANKLHPAWILAAASIMLAGCSNGEEPPAAEPADETSDSSDEPAADDSDSDAVTSDAPIQIGAHVALSGPLASNGESLLAGYQFAIDAVNAQGGVNGQQLELIVRDDGGDATNATNAVRELSTNESVTAVLGTYGSGAGLAGSAMAEQLGMPNIQPFASTPEMVSRDFEFLINTYALASQTQTIFAEMLIEEVRPETVAIVHIDNPYAIAGRDTIVAQLESTDIQIVLDERIAPFQDDYSAVVTQMATLAPDVVVLIVFFPDYITFIEQGRQFGLEPTLFYTDGSIPWLPPVLEALGTNADSAMGSADWFPGIDTGDSASVIEQYENESGAEATIEFVKGYQAVEILVDALLSVGSDPSAEDLRDALIATDIDTIAGRVTVGPDGQLEGEYSIVQLQDMAHEAVWPLERATAEWIPFKPWDER